MTMDPNVFATVASFLKAQSGLALTPDKAYLLNGRLQPVAEQHGCKSVAELVAKLNGAAPAQLKQDVVEAMTTNETSFFRDTTPFEIFKTHVLSQLMERRKVRRSLRILCAAASSGQEPYSLAMLMAENAARLAGWRTQILAVDLDTKILKRAEAGIYTQFEVQRGLPVQMLMKYFEQCPGGWKAKPEIRSMVQFQRCNLLEPFSHLGEFDVIFCRNVLIYFDTPTKRHVLDRLANQLAPDGFLFLGGAETVLDITTSFAPSAGHRGLYLRTEALRDRKAG
ncbi:MAG: protein-glutamate O-methyltransferase CheR [Rhodospirillaceae bacterium]